ncbi:MAG: DUF349 domain-containing protein [Bacteroidota bacterium]
MSAEELKSGAEENASESKTEKIEKQDDLSSSEVEVIDRQDSPEKIEESQESEHADEEEVDSVSSGKIDLTSSSNEAIDEIESVSTELKKEQKDKVSSEEDQKTEDSDKSSNEDSESHSEDHEELEDFDFSKSTKEDLVKEIEKYNQEENIRKIDNLLKQIRPAFDTIIGAEREAALEKFKADGGEEEGFEFRPDELINRFEASYTLLCDRKNQFYRQQGRQREENLEKKKDLLEQLRQLVDGDETTTSIGVLKDLQETWRNIGPVPGQHNKTLWANYNALIDRFYDNRSIYFELKELDRRKNLKLKLELCEKAESLSTLENIKDAVDELNKLHEEYKHIGPVPIEQKDELWARFKSASDTVYDHRREHFKHLKEELQENAVKKEELISKLPEFVEFKSDRISDWNKKTKELLELQKQWEAIGALPREKAKAINKQFWGQFKTFFAHKTEFFKELESHREENLEKKKQLVSRATELKDNTDWERTANTFKQLQREWREVGPVPEKFRESIYKEFKEACDHFFNKKRESNKEREKDFEDNLNKKEELCKSMEEDVKDGKLSNENLEEAVDQFLNIGFVPRNAIKSIQNRFHSAVSAYLKALDIPESDQEEFMIKIDFASMKSAPFAKNKLFKKEQHIKKQIGDLENDISTWRNNMEFFASSKQADKLKNEFEEKISSAETRLKELRRQLRLIKDV